MHKKLTSAASVINSILLLSILLCSEVQGAVWEMPRTWGEVVQELETRSALNAYDQQARQYFAPALRFDNPDPLAGNRPWESPYIFCGNNPVNYTDPDGRKITFVGTYNNCMKAYNIINAFIPDSYTYSRQNDPNSYSIIKSSREANYSDKENDSSHIASKYLDRMIDDEADIILNIESNTEVIIGDCKTSTIDIGDIERICNGEYVNPFEALFHEISEQSKYLKLDKGNDNAVNSAHCSAVGKENNVFNAQYDPNRLIDFNERAITVAYTADGKKYVIKLYFDDQNNIIR